MWIHTLSLFPEMFDALNYGVIGKAIKNGLLDLNHANIRDFATDNNSTVDDRPYGGGPGMVMKVEPVRRAIAAAKALAPQNTPVVYLSPQGERFDQNTAKRCLQEHDGLILLAGRYEGVDERIFEIDIDLEWSIGDYVLSGGEIAAMAVIDTITRLVPGTLGHEDSAEQDSFSSGLLDYPHYTRPEEIDGKSVPKVLLSGDHQAIMQWRLQQALGRTWLRRKDLLDNNTLSDDEQQLLSAFIRAHNSNEGSKNE